jgi:hypothetical protein
MLERGNGFGMNQSVSSGRIGRDFDPVMLTHPVRCFDKRFLGPKVRQRPLQGQRIAVLPNACVFTKRAHLTAAPSLTQPLL